MVSVIARIRQEIGDDKEFAVVIYCRNSLDEVAFLIELEDLLKRYGKEMKLVRVKEFNEVIEDV